MVEKWKYLSSASMAALLLGAVATASLAAQGTQDTQDSTAQQQSGEIVAPDSEGMAAQDTEQIDEDAAQSEATDARNLVEEAAAVVEQMKSDPELSQALQEAQGIFIVPDFGRVALGVGFRGGSGITLVRENGQWSDPAFYDFGALSVGAEAGVAGGSVAFLLMSDNAVQEFEQDDNFALNAEAGLTISDWSAAAQGSLGKGDIVFWTNTEGLYGGASISVSDIVFDEEETRGFYGQDVNAQAVFAGQVTAGEEAQKLKDSLPG